MQRPALRWAHFQWWESCQNKASSCDIFWSTQSLNQDYAHMCGSPTPWNTEHWGAEHSAGCLRTKNTPE